MSSLAERIEKKFAVAMEQLKRDLSERDNIIAGLRKIILDQTQELQILKSREEIISVAQKTNEELQKENLKLKEQLDECDREITKLIEKRITPDRGEIKIQNFNVVGNITTDNLNLENANINQINATQVEIENATVVINTLDERMKKAFIPNVRASTPKKDIMLHWYRTCGDFNDRSSLKLIDFHNAIIGLELSKYFPGSAIELGKKETRNVRGLSINHNANSH